MATVKGRENSFSVSTSPDTIEQKTFFISCENINQAEDWRQSIMSSSEAQTRSVSEKTSAARNSSEVMVGTGELNSFYDPREMFEK